MSAEGIAPAEPRSESVVELVDSLWGVYDPSFLVIKTDEKAHTQHAERVVVPFGDSCARDYILRLLRTRYGSHSIEEVYASEFCRTPDNYADRHLVLICGPEGSPATRLAMEKLELRHLFVGYSIRSLLEQNKVYGAPPPLEIEKEGLLVEYDNPELATPGLFLKTLSPFADPAKRVYSFILAGSRTFGTHAAAAITCSMDGLRAIGPYIGKRPPTIHSSKYWDSNCCAILCLMDREDGGTLLTNQGNRIRVLEPVISDPFNNPNRIEGTMQALEAELPAFQAFRSREDIRKMLNEVGDLGQSVKSQVSSVNENMRHFTEAVKQNRAILIGATALLLAALYFFLSTLRGSMDVSLNAVSTKNDVRIEALCGKIDTLCGKIDQRMSELIGKQDTEVNTLKSIEAKINAMPVPANDQKRGSDPTQSPK